MKKIIFAAVFAMSAVLGGYQNYASASSAGLSEMAKANVEALASVNGTLPNECDNCGTMGTSFCCNYYFNGQFITLYHLFVGPDDPIFD
ncbi:MAG: hypothetical protein IKN48_03015 [Bacteroidaceae bacterium]|nr:hypothetical protein [Bacteroidaceae bacterium]